MAEDRVIQALLQGCESGNTYSGWTTMHALLQRRYLCSHGAGDAQKACAFILKAFKVAAQPYLAAEIADKLCSSLLTVFQRYKVGLEDPFAESILNEVGVLFKSVVVTQIDSNGSLYGSDNEAMFKEDIVLESRTIHSLVPWLAARLHFYESVVVQLCREVRIDLPYDRSHVVDSSDSPICYTTRKSTHRWAYESFHAAYDLACCLSKREESFFSKEVLTSGDEKETTRSLLHSWSSSKAWIRAMNWSVYGESSSSRREHVKWIWQQVPRYLFHQEREWVLAVFVYNALSRSEVFQGQIRQNTLNETMRGNDCNQVSISDNCYHDYPALSAAQAIEVSRFAIEYAIIEIDTNAQKSDFFQKDKDMNSHLNVSSFKYNEWVVFLQCLVTIIDANLSAMQRCVSSDRLPRAHGNAEELYKRLYRSLSDFFSQPIKKLPFLDWEAVVATYC